MGKHHRAPFKVPVVRAALRAEKTLAQLASASEVQPTPISTWKTTVLQELPHIFERRERTASQVAAYDEQSAQRYAEIGRLTTPVAWAEKKVARYPRVERLAEGRPDHREERSGYSLHQPTVSRPPGGAGCPDQDGRQRARPGQHLRRAPGAHREGGGGVCAVM